MTVRITKEFRFEMAHALLGYDGPCRNIHGHSYRLLVTLKGRPLNDPDDPKAGMVMDFSDIRRIVYEAVVGPFDHALVLRRDVTPLLHEALAHEKLLLTEFQPTCENLVLHFADRLIASFPTGVVLYRLQLFETATSCAEWCLEDNEYALP